MTGNKITMQYLTDLKREGKARTEALKQAGRKALKKLAIFVLLFGLASGAGTYGLVKLNEWFEENTLVIKSPIEVAVKTNQVLAVVKREKTTIVRSEQAKIDAIVAEEDNPDLAKYICDKFGVVECRTALAVAKAEGMDYGEGDWNINADGTIDVGYFRINSTHFDQAGCSLSEVSTAKGNVDCAYSIYTASGWSPWVAYTSGAYLTKL